MGLVLLPIAAFGAKSSAILVKEVETFSGAVTNDVDDERAQVREQKLEGSKELFPDLSMASGALRSSVSVEPFISFKENGVTIMLHDVPRQAWFAPYVRAMVALRIASGYRDLQGHPTGEFHPERVVSVEEMAKMVVAATGAPLDVCGVSAKNLAASGSWSLPYVGCAEQENWALFSDGTVDLHRPALRGEVIMTVLEGFSVQIPLDASGAALRSPLSDVTPSVQFAPAIITAVRDGIVGGYPSAHGEVSFFRPGQPVNRAEVAKILSLAMQLYRK
ncbi:S-layer homology domain-containing protein [Candidatus Peregrinibacteria bacterium]|nr:S-layer homology domain-containing protein [Candidatus Peregrinibacteria bacterium]